LVAKAAAVGAAGVAAGWLIVTLVGAEIHPAAFLTVTEYVATLVNIPVVLV
jgi:hypothetical protein